MSKKCFLIISDLHRWDKNFNNRINYEVEQEEVLSDILRTAHSYSSRGYSVCLIFLGDIFHRSYTSISKASAEVSLFSALSEKFEIYVTVGNHEITYCRSNPFFSLFSEIKSDSLGKHLRLPSPNGFANIINIVDTLEVGNTVFYFNHYGCEIQRPTFSPDKKHIGLFHQELYHNEIHSLTEKRRNINIFSTQKTNINNLHSLQGYDYAFVGHDHQLLGSYLVDTLTGECNIVYCSTLGRTSVSEISDTFLDRVLPAVLIEDGNFVTVEFNKIQLKEYKLSLDTDIVEGNKDKYNRAKQLKDLRSYVPLLDDPIDNLRSRLMSYPLCLSIMDSILKEEALNE